MEERAARALLADGASRVLAWQRPLDSTSATLLFSSFSPPPADEELSALEKLFGDREAAIRFGMVIEGKRFEVHRHHPPLIYGREMGTEPARAEGAAVCSFEGGIAAAGAAAAAASGGKGCSASNSFAAISYRLPHVSARMVPLLEEFCSEDFGGGGEGKEEEEAAAAAGGGGAASEAGGPFFPERKRSK